MSAAELASDIRHARTVLDELMASDMRAWAAVMVHIGEAHEAVLQGDLEGARKRLADARAQEKRLRELRLPFAVADHMLNGGGS